MGLGRGSVAVGESSIRSKGPGSLSGEFGAVWAAGLTGTRAFTPGIAGLRSPGDPIPANGRRDASTTGGKSDCGTATGVLTG
jgi:hypothetical protein